MSLDTDAMYYANSATGEIDSYLKLRSRSEGDPPVLSRQSHVAIIALRDKIQEYEGVLSGGCACTFCGTMADNPALGDRCAGCGAVRVMWAKAG